MLSKILSILDNFVHKHFAPKHSSQLNCRRQKASKLNITMVIIALVKSSEISRWQQGLCEKAKNLLLEKNIAHKIVDRMDTDPNETSTQLFVLAGKIPRYPQFFVKDESDEIVYLGNFDLLKRMIDNESPFLVSAEKQKYDETRTPVKPVRRSVARHHSSVIAPEAMRMTTTKPEIEKSSSTTTAIVTSIHQHPKMLRYEVQVNEPASSKVARTPKTKTSTSPIESIRPSFIRGNSCYDFEQGAGEQEASPTRIAQTRTASLRPSFAQDCSYDESEHNEIGEDDEAALHQKTRAVKAVTALLRPSFVRGNSCYDFEQEVGYEASPTLIALTPTSSLRPSFVRGRSFDKPDNEEIGKVEEATLLEETRVAQTPTTSLRPSFVRGRSFEVQDRNDIDQESRIVKATGALLTPSFHDFEVYSGGEDLPTRVAQTQTASLRPSFVRGRSYDEPERQEIGNDKESLSQEKRIVKATTASLRPSFIRGNSCYDFEQEGGHDASPILNAQTQASSLRPSFIRGTSFDKPDRNEVEDDEEKELPQETQIAKTPTASLRPSFVRGRSFDEVDCNESGQGCQAASAPGMSYSPVTSSTMRPSILTGHSSNESEHAVCLALYTAMEKKENLSMPLNRLRPSVVRGDSYEDIYPQPHVPSFESTDQRSLYAPPGALRPSIVRGGSFDANQNPSFSETNSTHACDGLSETKIERAQDFTSSVAKLSDELSHCSLKKEAYDSKEVGCSVPTCASPVQQAGKTTAMRKDSHSLSTCVPSSKNPIIDLRAEASEPKNAGAANSNDHVKIRRDKGKRRKAERSFSVASGPNWLYQDS